MTISTFCRRAALAAAALLGAHLVQAQNNPVASPLVMAALMPVSNLSAAPAPEENAHFYDDTCKDLKQSLSWIQETNSGQPTYWNLYTEARILMRLKDYSSAYTVAQRARQLALVAPANATYVRLSDEVIRLAVRQNPMQYANMASIK